MESSSELFQEGFSSGEGRAWSELLTEQAQIFGATELGLLKDMAIEGPILDLGCGNGAFALLLRETFPSCEIIAVDKNKELIEEAQTAVSSSTGIQCFHWNAGESPFPNELRQCKTVFLRLVLQHLSDPHELLAQIRNEFSKGTRLVLIEEDLGTTFLHPPCRGYDQMLQIWRDYVAKYAGQTEMGRKLPELLSRAGFNIEFVGVASHTSKNIGLQRLLRFFADSLNILGQAGAIDESRVVEVKQHLYSHYKDHPLDSFLLWQTFVVSGEIRLLT